MLHTKHPRHGNKGKYFFFDENDFTKMVGETDWNNKKYEVTQRGSRSWTGIIKVWDSSNPNGIHGMRDTGEKGIENAAIGEWAKGDTIQLKA